jgi:transcriptional regulator with XRE-family HTH domain
MIKSISQIIRGIRTAHELSQEQMARDLRVSVNYISLIENNKKKPGMGFLKKFSALYNIPLLLLASEAVIPKAQTPKEKELQNKVINLINDLEKLFLQV